MKHKLQLLLCFLFLGVNAFSQNIPSYVPTNGLVGWWPFNGNANDESGNGNHGIKSGGIVNTTDRFGNSNKAFLFNGIDGVINLPSLNSLPYRPITYSAWVIVNSYLPSSWGHKFKAVIGRNTTYVFDNGVIGLFAANNLENGIYDNTFLMWRGGGTGSVVPSSKTIPQLNSWVHLVYTQNLNGDFYWYQNGSIVNSGNFTNSQNDFNFFQIGSCNNQSNWNTFWEGKLDDIAIWNRALTQKEITALYTGVPACNISSNIITQDTITACGNSFTLEAKPGFSSYFWSTGATSQNILATSTGWYRCSVLQGSCTATDSVFLSIFNASILQNDTTINTGASLTLTTNSNVNTSNSNYSWQLVSPGDCYKLVVGPSGKLFIPRRTDMLRSIDNGVTWSQANWPLGIVRSGTSLHPGSIYNSVTNQLIQCAIDNGYWVSNNDGGNFTQTGPTGFGTGGVEMMQLNNGRVLGSMGGFQRGVYKSNDINNNTWTNRYSGVDPYDFVSFGDSIIFSGTSNNLLRSTNQGDSWSAVLNDNIYDVEKIYDSLLWINSSGNVYVQKLQLIGSSNIARSNLGSGYYDAKYDPISKILIAANGSTGIYISKDNGRNWTSFTISGATSYYDVTIYNGSVYVGTNIGLFKTELYSYPAMHWSNGSTSQSITVTPSQTTTYYCTISNGISSCIDSVTIYVKNTINASSGANGTISPAGSTSANLGASQTYTFTPNSGYWIDSVIVNGVQVPTASSYTFNNLTSDQNIRVTYRSLAAALAAANICSNDTLVSTVNLPAQSNVRATTYYSNIYLFNQNNTNNAYKYIVNERKYTAIADKPTACIECGVAEANGKVYCFNTNGTTQAYDIASNTWQNQANQISNSTSSVYAASINNKIYVLGTTNNQNSFYLYNPQTNSYIALTNPTTSSSQSRLVAFNNKLYKIGGADNNNQPTASVEFYNPTNNTWTSMPDLPEALTQVGATYYDNKLHVFGGKQNNNTNSNKVYVFDFTSNAWYAESNTQNTNRTNIEAKTANGLVYLFGGTDTTNTQTNQAQRYFCKDQLCTCKWAEYVCNGVSQNEPCPIPTSSLYKPGTVFCDGYATKVVEVTNPITGKTWMDRNLGASRAATSSTDTLAYGDLYQWGRGADGHQCRNSATTTTLSTTDLANHSDFILPPNFPLDWRSQQKDRFWQGVNGINNPCPLGYRLPSKNEFENEVSTWLLKNSSGAFNSDLKLTLSGYRPDGPLGLIYGAGGSSYYWTNTLNSINYTLTSWYLVFDNLNYS